MMPGLPEGMPDLPEDDSPGFHGQTDDTLPGDKNIDSILKSGSFTDPLQGLGADERPSFDQDG